MTWSHRWMNLRGLGLALLCLAGTSGCGPPPFSRGARPVEKSFWVWNRSEPLTIPEAEALRRGGVRRLYWQVGELTAVPGGNLTLARTAPPSVLRPLPDGPEIVPVVRVATSIRSPEAFTGEALGRALRPVVDAAPGRAVQLDFDCPNRLLPAYAERLRTARRVANIRHLTITALASWSDAPGQRVLWSAADEIFPMLYDTEPDAAPAVPGEFHPVPLLDLARLRTWLAGWRRCPIPWHAGLPVFARVTVYDAAGRPQGHLRAWEWDDVVYNSLLVGLDQPFPPGTNVFRATRTTRLAGSRVEAGGFIAVRRPAAGDLLAAVRAADAAGARGVAFFRLPDPPDGGSAGGFSLAQTLASAAGQTPAPHPALRWDDATGSGRLMLVNDSDADLLPRLDGPTAPARGYRLEVQSPGAFVWREALPGDFHSLAAQAVPAAGDAATMRNAPTVAIPLATRLTFCFSGLPAHTSLATGLIQLSPDTDPATLRYRLPDLAPPGATPSWQALR